MNLLGPALALGAALAFTGFDVTRKQASPALHPFALTVWLQVVSLPFFVAWVALTGFEWAPAWFLPGLVSIGIQASASAIFLTALRIAPLSRTIPFLALTPVLSAGAGWAFLGEHPSPTALAGMALVTAGAFGLALQRSAGGFRVERGSLLMIGVAGLWSGGSAIDKYALSTASPPTHALLITAGIAVVFTLERAIRAGGPSGLRLPRIARRSLLLAGLFGTLALGLQLSAFEYTMVSSVETIKRAVGGTMALVIGRWLFEEEIALRSILAVLVMTAGTALVLEPWAS